MILPAQRRAAKVAIHRLGETATILEPTEKSRNAYGKIDGSETFQPVSEEKVTRTYTSSGSPEQARIAGGRYRTESPILLFAYDSAVEEGFRVEVRGRIYEVDSLTDYPTHFEATTTVVN